MVSTVRRTIALTGWNDISSCLYLRGSNLGFQATELTSIHGKPRRQHGIHACNVVNIAVERLCHDLSLADSSCHEGAVVQSALHAAMGANILFRQISTTRTGLARVGGSKGGVSATAVVWHLCLRHFSAHDAAAYLLIAELPLRIWTQRFITAGHIMSDWSLLYVCAYGMILAAALSPRCGRGRGFEAEPILQIWGANDEAFPRLWTIGLQCLSVLYRNTLLSMSGQLLIG